MFKKISSFLFYSLIIYFTLCFYLYFKQTEFIYFPSKNCIPNHELKPITDNNHLLGYENISISKQTIVIFHGNSGSALDRNYYQKLFPTYHLVFFEYPGYCGREDEALNKQNIIINAQYFLSKIQTTYPNHEIILLGESLGTGVASLLASQNNIKKLILVTPYSSIQDIASSTFKFLPISILLTENYNNIENLSSYKGNVFIIRAEKDSVITPKNSDKLLTHVSNKENVINIENAEHNNWFQLISKEQLLLLINFINSN